MTRLGSSRRSLLRGAALWAGAAAAGLGSVRYALGKTLFLNDPFQLGVASGDATADGFILWTRIAPDLFNPEALPPEALAVAWEVAADEGMKNIVAKGRAWARPDMAHSVHVDVRGLEPRRPYFYRFHCDGAVSRVGRALTLPMPRKPLDRMRFVFTSCAHMEQGYFSAYRDMIAQEPEFILHLGDYIYESAWSRPVRRHPGPVPVTLEEYRLHHAAYKLDPDLQAAHAYCSWFFTWDDHEVANDYSKNESQATADPASFTRRKLAAYKAYYEHMPLRPSAAFEESGMKMYQRVLFGDLAQFDITDGRQYRDPLPCQPPDWRAGRLLDITECADYANSTRSMLGKTQEAWLRDGFAKSGARWNLLAQALMFSDFDQIPGPQRGFYTDGWGGYPAARRRLLDVVKERKVGNVITLAGDIHSFFVADVKDDSFDLKSATLMSEFVGSSVTSQGFDSALFKALLPENPHIKFCDDTRRGYGVCDVTKELWRTDLRATESVKVPQATFSTLKSFAVENGRPGPQAA